MELLISIAKWGSRKNSDINIGGLYLVDFEQQKKIKELEIPVESGTGRAAGGLAIGSSKIYLAHPKKSHHDSILVIDPESFTIIEEKIFDQLDDIHQIDIYDGLLWVTNTNFNRVVVIDIKSWEVRGDWCIDETQQDERSFKPGNGSQRPADRDYRDRIHLNSIVVRECFFDVGHFGIEKGNFNSSQLTRVAWKKNGKHILFGDKTSLDIKGYVSPHNAMVLKNQEKLVCDSFHGDLIIGDSKVKIGGWPRGIAISKKNIFLGRSSHSYQELHCKNNLGHDAGVQMALFKIDKDSKEIVGRMLFESDNGFPHIAGQIYDVRIANGRDYAASQWASNGVNSLNDYSYKNLSSLLADPIQSTSKEYKFSEYVADEENVDINKVNRYKEFPSLLREKWVEVPGTRQDRVFSSEMLTWPDKQLLDFWEECKRETCVLEVRGWYQNVYKDMFNGCNIADIGPGIGLDGIFFAQHGANVTFVDIVENNLKLLERICKLKGIRANYYYIDDFFNFKFEEKFDAFLFIGSMINAPFDFTQRQVIAMTRFLKTGGKIAMLAYPKERYEQSGAKDCAEFGKMTDGERTPWCEWYDDDKIITLFGENFRFEWSRDFGKDNIEFNWFDLTKKGKSDLDCCLKQPSSLWLNFRGEHLFRNGRPEDALEIFTKVVAINPQLAVAFNNIGVYYWQNGNIEKTKNYFQKALAIDHNDRDTVLNSVRINVELSEVDEAKKIYSDYLKNNPEDHEILGIFNEINIPENARPRSHHPEDNDFPIVNAGDLQELLGFEQRSEYLQPSFKKPFEEWQMEIDDAPIFRYIYRNYQPMRHLEFGTWQGNGTVYCLEECNATVWTVNLPFGERCLDDTAVYGHYDNELQSIQKWADKIGLDKKDSYRTDSIGFIGRKYLAKQLGNRVCQIYCDSRDWDISNYPEGFFDSVLIDGGHSKEIVLNDSIKAFYLLRRGGIIMWHDFCPPMTDRSEVAREVVEAVSSYYESLQSYTSMLYWIYPSMILLGVKK